MSRRAFAAPPVCAAQYEWHRAGAPTRFGPACRTLARAATRHVGQRIDAAARAMAMPYALACAHLHQGRSVVSGFVGWRQDGPLVSVIMPVRDRPAVVLEAIASVLSQTWQRFELLVIDDGSQQDVAAIAAARFHDARIRVFRQPPIGVSAARNHGLRRAVGDVIAYLDSDNLWHPGFLSGMLRGFRRRPSLGCAYGMLFTTAHGARTVLWDAFDPARLVEANSIDLNVFVHTRRLYEELGGFDEGMSRLVDWDLVLRYTSRYVPARLAVLGAIYRIVDTQRISDVVPFAESLAKIRRKWRGPAAS